ncbi:unnamed protein product, partial [Chrysoparadoxa australica]
MKNLALSPLGLAPDCLEEASKDVSPCSSPRVRVASESPPQLPSPSKKARTAKAKAQYIDPLPLISSPAEDARDNTPSPWPYAPRTSIEHRSRQSSSRSLDSAGEEKVVNRWE